MMIFVVSILTTTGYACKILDTLDTSSTLDEHLLTFKTM